MKEPCVYIMASRKNGTLYTGVTSNIQERVYQHRENMVDGFTRKYNCKILVWFELHGTMYDAITREKQIKGSNRARKIVLIEENNLKWRDLYSDLF